MEIMPLRYPAEQQSGPVVRLPPPDGYDMELMVENVTNLYAASVDLYYDPDKVNIEEDRNRRFDSLEAKAPGWNWLIMLMLMKDCQFCCFPMETQTIGGTGTLVKIYYRLVDKKKA